MRRVALVGLICVFLVLAVTGTALAAKGVETIQGGKIVSSSGTAITVGYDAWGYNYQAHMFNGYYGNYYRPATPVTSGDLLVMKWNDAWLANTSADGDFALDRHYGFTSYKGSGAWCTNHYFGSDGYEYFCKVVAVPTDAVLAEDEPFTGADGYLYTEGVWYAAEGTLIGPNIWGEFAVTQEESTGGGSFHTIPGLGNW